ncbi:MAG: cobalt-precorrin-4/precorrin-4 C(11)-methyltransferase, partial [Rhodospirillaceae bacterium]
RLDALAIPWEICPGVPAYAAAAAALGRELTLPDVSQSVILTRTAVRTGSMPNQEDLETFGRSGATLAIHLSVNNLAHVVKTLSPLYGADCPVAVVYRVTWPDQGLVRGTLADIRDKVKAQGWTRTALILVGRVLDDAAAFPDSHLYDAAHDHVLRPASAK